MTTNTFARAAVAVALVLSLAGCDTHNAGGYIVAGVILAALAVAAAVVVSKKANKAVGSEIDKVGDRLRRKP